jgi:hypothetical protein
MLFPLQAVLGEVLLAMRAFWIELVIRAVKILTELGETGSREAWERGTDRRYRSPGGIHEPELGQIRPCSSSLG